ncbi:MAG: tRNA pseudouridine(55) synthase TruB [Parcubacteria group bacterium CG22_combo_CG10-13_8_21_14_all_41_9]|nr:MAG: tRNA pseudouridine(55) synthase TruB [Parcubacteria group bacterium CG22_combo_CG10-13_8_21_14_all_41_9]
MEKSQEQTNYNGFLLVNKPSGPTSHDIIDQLRRIALIRQIGHAGTLDPFASGLLLVGIGEATKLLRHYVGLDKKYEAILKLGAVSDTYDRTGNITKTSNSKHQTSKKYQITNNQIKKILKSFIGKQKQTPPMYSAKKIKGKKLYELARKGIEVKRKAQDIEIYDIKLVSYKDDILKIECRVSSGTYIRTLAHDIGQKLGCGAYLEELKRTRIGDFELKDAIIIRHPEAEKPLKDLVNNAPASLTRSFDFTPAEYGARSAQDDVLSHLTPLKTILVSGTFDWVHAGHKNYFQQARKLGHRLIAIVGRDSMVQKIKNRKPRLSEKTRIKQVKACEEIDRVYLGVDGSDAKVYDFVASLQPDIIALGYDQKAYTENLEKEMKKRNLNTKIIRLKPYEPNTYKSSILAKTVDRKSKKL